MRLFITGGSSYLGKTLAPLARAAGHTVAYTYFQHPVPALAGGLAVDLRRATAVAEAVAAFRPDVIIHTAGSNRVDDMTAVIVDGTRHVVAAARAVRARLIHLSTDSIFDGQTPPYDETAVARPVNDYGRAKAAAETIVAEYANHVIVRTSLIYGFQEMDHSTRWIAAALRAGEPVTLFTNQFRQPVWVNSLGEACLELAAGTFQGVINIAGSQRLSRAEFGLRLLDWWRIEPRQTLTMGPSTYGRWPLDTTFDLSLATTVLHTPLPGVDAVLAAKTAEKRQEN